MSSHLAGIMIASTTNGDMPTLEEIKELRKGFCRIPAKEIDVVRPSRKKRQKKKNLKNKKTALVADLPLRDDMVGTWG